MQHLHPCLLACRVPIQPCLCASMQANRGFIEMTGSDELPHDVAKTPKSHNKLSAPSSKMWFLLTSQSNGNTVVHNIFDCLVKLCYWWYWWYWWYWLYFLHPFKLYEIVLFVGWPVIFSSAAADRYSAQLKLISVTIFTEHTININFNDVFI